MVYATAEVGWTEGLEVADRIWDPVYRSHDAQEGPLAFSEKRAPRWTAT
jgi:enoyl-CoA hydratase/carnithine racemase